MRIDDATELTDPLAREITALVDAVSERLGRRALGEDAERHLASGATSWTGLLARDEAETLVGVATLQWSPPGSTPRAVAEIVVEPTVPDPDALARDLLEAAIARVREHGGGALWLWVHHVSDPSDTCAARAGLDISRDLAVMTRPLAEPPEVVLPEGVRLRRYEPGPDDDALLEVNNAAFADHPEQGGWDADTLAGRRARSWFDPADVLLAARGDRVVGLHWTKRHDQANEAPVGEVYVLGVHPDEQGTGLGRGLLAAGLAHLHERGCRRVLLYVDLASAGAVRLYESAGFEIAHHEVCYEARA